MLADLSSDQLPAAIQSGATVMSLSGLLSWVVPECVNKPRGKLCGEAVSA